MNFVGHIAIGVAVDAPRSSDTTPFSNTTQSSNTTFLLGTALPDFAAMARLKLDRGDGPLGRGMQLHHDTDAVFHRQGWFLDLEHQLFSDLLAAGLPRGGALACAHVGVELVLDGELLRRHETAEAVTEVYGALAAPPDVAIIVAPAEQRRRWGEHLSAVATHLDPFLYADPISVAQRLHRITSSRPRLAFEPEHVPTVAEHLAAVQPQIGATAGEILDRVTAALG